MCDTYNSGIIKDMDEDTCLVRVDTVGHGPAIFPFHMRVPQVILMVEHEAESEDKNMTNYEWLVKNRADFVKDILRTHIGKEKGIPSRCSGIHCQDCDFNCGDCNKRTEEWFEQEHEPLYKKGDIVVGPFYQIFVVVGIDCWDENFIIVSRYTDSSNGQKMHINEIKKKIGYMESEVSK